MKKNQLLVLETFRSPEGPTRQAALSTLLSAYRNSGGTLPPRRFNS